MVVIYMYIAPGRGVVVKLLTLKTRGGGKSSNPGLPLLKSF